MTRKAVHVEAMVPHLPSGNTTSVTAKMYLVSMSKIGNFSPQRYYLFFIYTISSKETFIARGKNTARGSENGEHDGRNGL